MKQLYQVWSQGYMANGTEGKVTAPNYHGSCLAKSFEEAIIKIFNATDIKGYFDRENLTYYGSKLFPSFKEALESIKINDKAGYPNEYGYLDFKNNNEG